MRRPHSNRALIKTLPSSKMVYPEALTHRIKYYLWLLYSPCHPKLRDGIIALKVLKNYGRQPHILGKIAPHLSIEEFIAFLVEKGYAYHRVAWEDEDEVVSLRYVENFIYQYHIRVFEDGEVRGHYEYTPECYPMRHLWNIGQENRREEFLRLFGDRVVPHTGDQFNEQWEFLPLMRRLRK